jgi:hypothetical protein
MSESIVAVRITVSGRGPTNPGCDFERCARTVRAFIRRAMLHAPALQPIVTNPNGRLCRNDAGAYWARTRFFR